MAEVAVGFADITKSFPGVVALSNVTLEIATGSCHALCGENGAGKSTLGKILAGIHRPDSGRLLVFGKPRRFNNPRDALPAQLAYVDKGIAPVLLAQPVYEWGYVGVKTIVDHLHFKKDVPQIIPMELVKVNKESLGNWARQLKAWGFSDVPNEYLQR